MQKENYCISYFMETGSEDDGKKVTNLDYLLKLSKGNEEFVRDMIRIFLDENPSEISVLEKAIAERDFKLINSAAHKLRSTVPFVGIDKIISEDITLIEQLAREKSDEQTHGGQAEEKAQGGSFLPNDREMISRIESLFSKIKRICLRAYSELKPFTSH